MNAMTARKSALAALLILFASLGSLPGWAEESMEEVVVTGSLIKGTPVDAALPVEVFTASDMEDVGAPTALEFVKSLTASGPTYGEAYYFGGSSNTNLVGYNLRGIGADKTLQLFAGRRSFDNASNYPAIAIGRVEILKDGAAVTYGADATGGVVNYIPREDFEGIEVQTSYKAIPDSDGDWNLGVLAGKQFGDTNLMFSLEWEHRSELDTLDRDFSSHPYGVNPAPWSTLTSLAGWVPRGSLPATPGNTANSYHGTPLGLATDYTQSSCEAVGGVYVNSYTCKYNYAPYYNIVEESEVTRFYIQSVTDMTDRAQFKARMFFMRNYRPHQYGSPGQPVIRGPSNNTGATYQFYVPVTNPYVAEFTARSGWDSSPYAGFTQGFTPITYRAFSHGGNDAFAEGDSHSTPNENETNTWHIAFELDGTMENEISYNVGVTYNQYYYNGTSPDVLGHRLQEALNGFGGPDCNVPDLDPVRFGTQNAALAGTGNCMWWNPFASSFKNQPMLGLDNPSYGGAAYENDLDLARWLFDVREYQSTEWNGTLDAVLNGPLPIELGGGPIAWGAGIQVRHREYRVMAPSDFYNGNVPCQWPGQDPADPSDATYTGCTPDKPGPFVFFDPVTPAFAERKQLSYFLELDFPITEDLYVVAATRYEEFQPGNLDTTVYKVSFKWQITENLALRGSYGDNYQAPGITIIPGEIDNVVRSYTVAAGNWRGAQLVYRSDIVPETATVWSTGLIWQSEGFAAGHDFQFIADYFSIETEDELGQLASAPDIADDIFSIPADPAVGLINDGSNLANCAHPLIGRVTFNGGACVQGTTSADDFASISTDYGNGPGQTTSGYDVNISYGFPAFDGDVRLSLVGTIVNEFKFTETTLDGYLLDPGDDRLGHLNFATIAFAAPERRINFNANYAFGIHNFRFVAGHISAVTDERGPALVAGRIAGTTTNYGPTSYGVSGDDWLAYDLHYHGDYSFGTVSVSIVNITDEDPPPAREELGYDPRIGSPLGRTIEVGWRKEF